MYVCTTIAFICVDENETCQRDAATCVTEVSTLSIYMHSYVRM